VVVIVHNVDVKEDFCVSEEHASIFRTEVCGVSNWLSYIGGLQRRQSIRPTERSEEISVSEKIWFPT
jgi:hypothetical protein